MRLVVAALASAALIAPAVVAAPASGPEVVRVSVRGMTGPADHATGFVAGDGLVVTVAHVLDGRPLTVGGRAATLLRRDRRLDLALLSAPGVEGDAPRIAAHATHVTIDGRRATVLRRVNARLDGSTWRRPVIELRADVSVGDSGAPVLTPTGRIAGVVFARSRTRERIVYAVEGPELRSLLRRR